MDENVKRELEDLVTRWQRMAADANAVMKRIYPEDRDALRAERAAYENCAKALGRIVQRAWVE